ncbi:restriction endonuclease subunit S [Burkholderia glumae]|nr:restriction endonuclease subunit S [Burkholderia glumae]
MGSKLVAVEEVAAPTKNAIVGGPFGSNLVSRDYVSEGVPVIRGQNMGNKWVGGEFAFVSNAKATELSPNKARPGDLVFTQRGTLGQVAIVPPAPFAEYIVSQSQMKLTPDLSKVDVHYLYYAFRSPEQQEYIRNSAIQTGVPHTNLGILKKTPVVLPSLTAQREIASVLCALDDRIDLLRETNATLEAIAQALFKSWFVDFDPVRAKQDGRAPEGMDEVTAALFPDAFEESELGLVPRGWRASNLGKVVAECGGTIQTGPFGSQLHASDYVESGIPVVMPKDIQGRRVVVDTIARIRPSDADRLERHKLNVGDIVFSRRGDVERHALIGNREVGWLCGTGCLLVRPGASFVSSTFLSMTLDSPSARRWLVQHAVGATMPNLNTAILGSVPVLIPPNEVLTVFENVISTTEAQISQNSATAETFAALRDTLLPRLISGQLRLPEAEAEALAA